MREHQISSSPNTAARDLSRLPRLSALFRAGALLRFATEGLESADCFRALPLSVMLPARRPGLSVRRGSCLVVLGPTRVCRIDTSVTLRHVISLLLAFPRTGSPVECSHV